MEGIFAGTLRDVLYGLRMGVRAPVLSAALLLSMALGIGANVAVFGVIDALLLRPLPVANPNALICIDPVADPAITRFTYAEYVRMRDGNTVLDGLAAEHPWEGKVSIGLPGREPAQASLDLVSGSYFSTLGVGMYLGQRIEEDDQRAEGGGAAVISYDLWKGSFGGNTSTIGRTMMIDGSPFTVIGVARPGFSGTIAGNPAGVFVPLGAISGLDRSFAPLPRIKNYWLDLIGRRKPGANLTAVQTDLSLIYSMVASEQEGAAAQQQGGKPRPSVNVTPGRLGRSPIRNRLTGAVTALMVIVLAVLVIACGNIANVMLFRSVGRRRELAMRVALGARRARIVRQLLTEGLTISLLGGALGLVMAYGASQALLRLLSDTAESIRLDTRPDPRVLMFAVGLSILTGLLFSLLPAIRAGKIEATQELTGVGGRATGWRAPRLMMTGQAALCLVLLVAAALFTLNLANLKAVTAGFDSRSVYQVSWELPDYPKQRLLDLLERITREVDSVPGVVSSSISADGLFSGTTNLEPIGLTAPPSTDAVGESDLCRFDWVGPDYFSTVGAPIIQGRSFLPTDALRSPATVVINEALAHKYFGSTNPIGKRIYLTAAKGDPSEIVGVSADAKHESLREASKPGVYVLHGGEENPINFLEVREAPGASIAMAVRRKLEAIDPNLKVDDVSRVADVVNQTLWKETAIASLSGFFGFLALVLAGLGLYGTVSYSVGLRTPEIGVRMALGARPATIQRLVLTEVTISLVAALCIGLPLGLMANRLLSSLIPGVLFKLSPGNPLAMCLGALFTVVVCLIAGYLPARKAARVDPMLALRHI